MSGITHAIPAAGAAIGGGIGAAAAGSTGQTALAFTGFALSAYVGLAVLLGLAGVVFQTTARVRRRVPR